MNVLTGIIAKQQAKDKLNLLWSPSNILTFDNTIRNYGHTLIPIEHIYFGYYKPQLVVCNNKISHYRICKTISVQYHIPIVVIDHLPMDSFINYEKIKYIDDDKNTIKIATSNIAFKSWKQIHNYIIEINDIKEWNIIFHKIIREIYKI